MNKPERVFDPQVQYRELDIFKIVGIVWEIAWKCFGFSGNYLGIFWRMFLGQLFWKNSLVGIFGRKMFRRNFWEEFLGRIFWGGILALLKSATLRSWINRYTRLSNSRQKSSTCSYLSLPVYLSPHIIIGTFL